MAEQAHVKFLKQGLAYALKDLEMIARLQTEDVKPKEDQIKCGLYRAFSENGYLVQVEAAYAQNGMRCDLRIQNRRREKMAVEIKTAWAGDGWVNKPVEQGLSWDRDIVKLRSLIDNKAVNNAYFILLLACQAESRGAHRLNARIAEVPCHCVYKTVATPIPSWNGLDRLQAFVFDANKPAKR